MISRLPAGFEVQSTVSPMMRDVFGSGGLGAVIKNVPPAFVFDHNA